MTQLGRWIFFLLVALLIIIQMQLWFGRGSIPDVKQLKEQITEQKNQNTIAERENARLESELNDLQNGLSMVEERARVELGMVKSNEVFVQIVTPR